MCGWCTRHKLTTDPTKPQPKPPTQWGLTDPMCGHFFSVLVKALPGCNPAYSSDYAKIYSVMMDGPLVTSCLQKLDNAIMSKPHDVSPETNWLRFSSILSYYEKKCWFPEDILLPLGILASKDFYFYIRRGYVLKDYGAGVKHGEFTHRLQWHVIMRVITQDFTKPIGQGWDHSPLELYVSLGMKQNHGLWVKLFDSPGDGDLNHPDSFHHWVLTSNLLNIVAYVTRRETKRRQAFVQAICDYIKSNVGAVNVPIRFSTTTNPFFSHDAYKDFEKWFVKDVLQTKHTEKEVEKIYYKDLTAQIDSDYLKTKTTTQTSKKSQGRTKPYKRPTMALGPVYSFSATCIIDEQAADVRAKNSRAKLNVA